MFGSKVVGSIKAGFNKSRQLVNQVGKHLNNFVQNAPKYIQQGAQTAQNVTNTANKVVGKANKFLSDNGNLVPAQYQQQVNKHFTTLNHHLQSVNAINSGIQQVSKSIM